jgi:hypothetical protein
VRSTSNKGFGVSWNNINPISNPNYTLQDQEEESSSLKDPLAKADDEQSEQLSRHDAAVISEDALDSQELQYLKMLNRLLPKDIRVLSWTPVKSDFDARFSCQWRKYKYFFPTANLDIEKMNLAASMFVGTHDCRYVSHDSAGHY